MKRYAGFGERLLASFLDVIIISILFGILFYAFTGEYSMDVNKGMSWDIFYVIYLIVIPVLWSGYIIGKRICNIKLKRIDGGNVKLSNTIMRELVGFHLIGIVTFGLSIVVSVFMVIFREDKRAIHDFVGGTYVSKG
ncbi:RDD family protein [Aquibacillus kalidii]|uniref:RDD family protein n=1 Tax=Aquibacillus kalidii TaxID=2762597 RepID=UPI0016456665|nr:RDD family protein [Aquibacillus kalidii]